MGQLERDLNRVEGRMIALHVERQLAWMRRICAGEGLPDLTVRPEIRRNLEDHARWTMANAPLGAELVEAEIQRSARELAADLGIDPAELIAEAERLAERYPVEV